jgi:hypothetical protein
MVAYSFNQMFHADVESLNKRQTVRAHRKRHAHPHEPVQLYAGMRTRYCRKLVTPDPICTSLSEVQIVVTRNIFQRIRAIEINGISLNDEEIEAFAIEDGFKVSPGATARDRMGRFWSINHGPGLFSGVLIKWEPAQ